tara:strand:+ start:2883 stop:3506 length:624 start_codon:yes stop_codon:yes gene_type:complete
MVDCAHNFSLQETFNYDQRYQVPIGFAADDDASLSQPKGMGTLMDFRYLYTSFDGRINRKPFWIASVIMIVAAILFSVVIVLPLSAASPILGALASLVLSLVLLYPAAAIGVKRLHDRGRHGQLMAAFVAPGLILQVGELLGLTGSLQLIAGQSVYLPNTLGWMLNLIAVFVGIWALVTLGFLAGTSGANRYGPDPRASEAPQPATG